MNPTRTATPANTRKRWRWAAVLVFVGLLWALLAFSGLDAEFSLQAVRDGFARHRAWGLLAFTGLFVLANLAHVPGGFFLVAAVVALGPVWGGLVTYAAACLACITTFAMVRLLGADALRGLKGRLMRRLFAQLDAHPLRSVILLRLCFHSVPALNYALALSGVPWRHYVLGTLLGLLTPVVVVTALLDTLAAWLGWPLG